MNDKQIVESMAMLDGYYYERLISAWKHPDYHNESFYTDGDIHYNQIPSFLTDHNAVQRVISGLNDNEASEVMEILYKVTSNDSPTATQAEAAFMKATPRHICEAILKSKEIWE